MAEAATAMVAAVRLVEEVAPGEAVGVVVR